VERYRYYVHQHNTDYPLKFKFNTYPDLKLVIFLEREEKNTWWFKQTAFNWGKGKEIDDKQPPLPKSIERERERERGMHDQQRKGEFQNISIVCLYSQCPQRTKPRRPL